MEELKLDDLSFESSSEDVFNVFDTSGSDKPVKIEEPKNKEIPNSEVEIKSPESVAKKEENIQEGKTPAVNEGEGNSSSPKQNDTEKLYSSLANEFKAKGVLSSLDLEKEKITSMEDINKAIEKEIESRLTDKQKLINEAIKVGAPADEVSRQLESIEKLKSIPESHVIKEENFEFRRNVIAQDFINKGFSKEKAIAFAQRSIDSGDDIEDATVALKEIIDHEQSLLDESINSKKTQESEAITKIKEYIGKDEEIIPGVKLTTAQKEEFFNQVTNDLGNKENAFIKAQKQDPLGSRMKLEALFYLTKGLKDFSVFSNTAKSKASNELESLLRGANFTEEGRINTNVKDELSTFTLKDLEGVSFE